MATPVALGPFSGGLNNVSDSSALKDNELVECVNFNVDIDGSLVCRPPISQAIYNRYPLGGDQIIVIGKANIGSDSYLIINNADRTVSALKYEETANGIDFFDVIHIAHNIKSRCAVQFHNSVFVLATTDSPTNTTIWNGGYLSSSSPSAPRGGSATFFKGRMWVTPGINAVDPKSSQLVFSDPIPLVAYDPTVVASIPWAAENLIPVGQGDGENLVDLLVVNDNLMLFKNNSTYVYMYNVSPNDGILRKVNNDIGVSTEYCVLTHGNEAYCYHEGKVYQIANFIFTDIADRLALDKGIFSSSGLAQPVCMSLLGDFILLRYYNRLYSHNLITKTWSLWESSDSTLNSIGRIVKLETNEVSANLDSYYGGSCIEGNTSLLKLKERHSVDDGEYIAVGGISPSKTNVTITCKMTTKVFDFGTPFSFKRLMWWGMDVISDGTVVGTVIPGTIADPVTWDMLLVHTWDTLYSWDSPLVQTAYVQTVVDDTSVLRRKFVKLLKSLRFRQIAFSITLTSNGKIKQGFTQGPARVMGLSAIIGNKQIVSKQVN